MGGVAPHGELEHVRGSLAEQEWQEDIADLEEKYPNLQRDEVAEQVLVEAREFCEEQGLDPANATLPGVLELAYLRSVAGRQGGPQQQPRPGRARDNGRGGLAFGEESAEAKAVNDAIIERAGPTNIWGW